MSTLFAQSTILVIGNDPILAYLLKRYTEQSGCLMILRETTPEVVEIDQLRPAAIIYASIERLQVGQSLVDALSTHELPLLVCAALADEAHALELGADACLLHPFTYENFWTTLTAVCPSKPN